MKLASLATFAIVVAVFLVTGCSRLSTTTSDIDGVNVAVLHPDTGHTVSNTIGGDGETVPHRFNVQWVDGAGAKLGECNVEMLDHKLQVGGKRYGAVRKGDSVTIEGAAVKVNGQDRKVE